MKNDREFLDGIYQKAEILKKEKSKQSLNYNKYIRYSSLAALLVLVPILLFNSQLLNKDKVLPANMPRVASMLTSDEVFANAEYVIIGETENREEINPDAEFVEVNISISDTILGKMPQNRITLSVEDYIEAEFKEGERDLLFLYKDGEKFRLINALEGKFKSIDKDNFEDPYGNQYSIEEIKQKIKGENIK
jgi:hypothetical protein